MPKIVINGIGEGSKKKITELANKKEVSVSEYSKHVLLDHLKEIEEKNKKSSYA